ncbi:hypothetical protein A2686_02390 [Candidatus Woesebacteria bacterium RIFCSPHIGHO2_01_FULL_38_10]|uniref:Uncharacterized protein n=1 Tax=Candidatus Woesebacteria bacterium RIFCSPLOWO2_01_FULL_39_10b TaxID=1802517 RepID=A0A1F8B9R6_9BACT|nr:MAG: hypothetical protein A2686_02390 [Candidatus Woesebacteria bacterium RIFCSPHIGHO2_01_FULL_38_10]OGM60419.1 MAG: hypothetical protein A2892_00080 [Candidatus Woesebacteria bacterium RIFCSPLOWO2_01_FULL_39_10b]
MSNQEIPKVLCPKGSAFEGIPCLYPEGCRHGCERLARVLETIESKNPGQQIRQMQRRILERVKKPKEGGTKAE